MKISPREAEKTSSSSPRQVSREALENLDPIERVVADKFLQDGRWVVREAT